MLGVTGVCFTDHRENIVVIEGYVAQGDEFDVDAPSAAKPVRPSRDLPAAPEGRPAEEQV